jgi:ApaG protein
MTCKTTKGVKVSIKPHYEGNYFSNEGNIDVFTYDVIIENNTDYTIKLLKRHWYIFDAADYACEVEGSGVVGEQPILCPGESHYYQSGSHLKSPIGSMKGDYLFKRMVDDSVFKVEIPQFQLLAPFVGN